MKTKLIIIICMLMISSIAVPALANNYQNNILDNNYYVNKTLLESHQNAKNNLFESERLDIAVTNAEVNQIGILLGNETGAFTYFGNSTVGQYPLAITGGDYNLDGNFDLISSNFMNNSITVLFCNGNGTFAVSGEFDVGIEPFSIITDDFNKDDNPDIAVVNFGENTVSVLLGDGTGNFSAQQKFTVGNYPSDVISGDFNNDNNTDLIVVSYTDDIITILLGDGTGEFTFYDTVFLGNGYSSFGMTTSDFNNDGNLDLAVASGAFPIIGVLLGDGTGNFGVLTNFTVGYGADKYNIVSDDFNNDGNQDLAVPNPYNNTISVLIGDGMGSFGPQQTYEVGLYPVDIVSGDFNSDGNVDLAVPNTFDNTISILLGYGNGSFAPQQTYYAGQFPVGIITANFDYVPPTPPPPPPVPAICCEGNLIWSDVKAEATVTGTFKVKNCGEEDSLLNWTITSKPNWGTWSFTPSSGINLAEGEYVTIKVTVVAPSEKKKTFTGDLTVTNTDDPTDFCKIDISLTTPKARLHQFALLQRLAEMFPNLNHLIRIIFRF